MSHFQISAEKLPATTRKPRATVRTLLDNPRTPAATKPHGWMC